MQNQYELRLGELANAEGYELTGPYVNSSTKVGFRHTLCGYEFDMTPNKFLQGRRCARCAGVERYTPASFKAYVEKTTGGKWSTDGTYAGTHRPVGFLCGVCGATHNMKPTSFREKDSLSKPCSCGNPFHVFERRDQYARLTDEVVRQLVRERLGEEYELLDEYVNTMTPVRVRHSICGTVSLKRVDAMIHHGEGCLVCSGHQPITATLARKMIEASGTHRLVSDTVVNNKTPLELEHIASGKKYTVRLKDFVHKGHRGHHSSANEEDLAALVTELTSGTIVRRHDRTAIAPMEIDIYVPSMRIGVEYNGSYYHSDRFRTPSFHRDKYLAAKEAGIRLIQVSDSDWIYRNAIVRSKLAHLFGRTVKRLSARHGEVVLLEPAEGAAFLEATHLQGAPNGVTHYIGLRIDGRLESVLAWTDEENRLGRRGAPVIEITRFASALDTTVRGAFGRLVAALKAKSEGATLVTFADHRWSDGDLYKNSGWETVGIVPPRYDYVHAPSARAFHRSTFTKAKIRVRLPDVYDATKTERQMMLLTNYVRVYDAGKTKFQLVV